MTETAGGRKAVFIDAACLALITLLSALPYITRIGFYSDDWFIVASFHDGAFSPEAILRDFPSRPLQGLYLAGLFKLFDLNPAGYHVVNTTMIALSAIAFYLLLLRLRFGRVEAFASATLFLMLPQLSTVRVWVAAAQVPLSMLLALGSMHAQLSFVESRKAAWAVAAAAAAIGSLLAYEIFAALIIAFPLWIASGRWGRVRTPKSGSRGAVRIAVATIAVTLILAALLKVALSERARLMEPYDYLVGAYRLFSPGYDWRIDYGPNIFAAIDVYVWQTLGGWLGAMGVLLGGGLGPAVTATVAVIGLVAFWRMSPRGEFRPGRLALAGLAIFLLGHAVFLVLPGLMFSPTGLANRVSVAGAPGLAMLAVAILAFAASWLPWRWRPAAVATSIALVVIAAAARLTIVENHWAEASKFQDRILDTARQDLASVPAGSTVIVDGVCPYHGPGVVFETWWDTGPALSLALNRKINGDVVSERTKISERGIETSIYDEPTVYPFEDNLYLYDPTSHVLTALPDWKAARAYFAARRHVGCPRGYVGQGELI